MTCLKQGHEKNVLALLPNDTAAEGCGLRYSNRPLWKEIVNRVSQIADGYSFRIPRVIYSALVPKSPFLVQQKRVACAYGSVGFGNCPILIFDVWEIEALLLNSQDHFSIAVGGRKIGVV